MAKAPNTGDLVRSKSTGRYYVVKGRCGKRGNAFLLDLASWTAPGQPQALTTTEVERVPGGTFYDDAFECYFGVADELDGGLTLDDLDPSFVLGAKAYADERHASWPPALAEAEEILLDRREAEWRRKNSDAYRKAGY